MSRTWKKKIRRGLKGKRHRQKLRKVGPSVDRKKLARALRGELEILTQRRKE